jgi:tetratricopeptide (TPR) repeat protein
MVKKAADRAGLYSSRALASSKGSEEAKKYAMLALAELDCVIELINSEDIKEAYIDVLFAKATMMALTDQPEETIKITDEALSLNEKYPEYKKKYPGYLEVHDIKIYQAEAYVALGKWKEAENKYETLYKAFGIISLPLVHIGLMQTKYVLGKYDEAIKISSGATKCGQRYWPGFHKYIALSQKAKGNIDEAKKIITRAILYEEHWDKGNLQKNKQILRELNGM